MPLSFDHALITVPSLADACMDFAASGFTVTAGGRHEGTPTENALVVLEDGTYLELLALREPAMRDELRARRTWRDVDPLGRRFLAAFLGPYGVADCVFRTSGLERYVSTAKLRGVPVDGPFAMGRERPDGVRLAWKLALPLSRELPFLIEDVTPVERRIPEAPDRRLHANGARTVDAVEIAVGDLDAALELWRQWLELASIRRVGDEAVVEVGALRVHMRPSAGGRPGSRSLTLAGAGTLSEAVKALRVTAA
ncbi:MAG: VOC family protein [Candidatus Eisenbacteria bacterium]